MPLDSTGFEAAVPPPARAASIGNRFQRCIDWMASPTGSAVVLAVVTLAAHGWSLGDGLMLDDHCHYQQIRQCDWSFSALLDATTIDYDNLATAWWQEKPVRFKYARPVSVALMKAVYTLTDGSVTTLLAINLLLHWIAGLLVYRLCRRVLGSERWSLYGALLFVLYPLSVFAVDWLAAQNMVLQTTLMLASLLCYLRGSVGGQLLLITGGSNSIARRGSLSAAIVFWILALFSRENAIMLPAIFVAVDLAYGGWPLVRARLRLYALLAGLAGIYLIWRLGFYYYPMPDVYVRRYDGPGYILWWLVKLLHFLCCAIWIAPMTIGPTGRFHPITDAPFDFALMLIIVASAVLLYLWLARRVRGWWIWPLWILLSVLPVVPVLATPHSSYLCGVGGAVAFSIALAGLRARFPGRGRWCAYVAATVIILVCALFAKVDRLMWRGMAYAEQFSTHGMLDDPPDEQVTDVFFVNLPFAAVYSGTILGEAANGRLDDTQFHVLTFAPHLLRMDADCVLTPLDDHRLSLRIDPGRPYFSGLLGRFLIDGFRDDGLPKKHARFEKVTNGEFSVDVVDENSNGITALEFTFAQPLASPRYCFYICSEEAGSIRLRFPEPGARPIAPVTTADMPTNQMDLYQSVMQIRDGDVGPMNTILDGLGSDDAMIVSASQRALQATAEIVAQSMAAPQQRWLTDPVETAKLVEPIRQWWFSNVDSRMLHTIFHDRERWMDIRHRRDEIKRGRALIRRFVHCDLYLTGRPFPGVR